MSESEKILMIHQFIHRMHRLGCDHCPTVHAMSLANVYVYTFYLHNYISFKLTHIMLYYVHTLHHI